MKKSFLCAIVLTGVYLIAFPQSAQAQYVYSYSEIVGDRSSRGVYGYSATYLDYEAGYYYDPAVLSDLLWQYDNETSLDGGYSEGYADLIDAEVWTFAYGYEGVR